MMTNIGFFCSWRVLLHFGKTEELHEVRETSTLALPLLFVWMLPVGWILHQGMWFSVFTEDFICMRTGNLGGPTRNVSCMLLSFWLWTNSHNKHSWDLHISFLPKPIQARNSRVENKLTTQNNSFLSHQGIFSETLFFQFFCWGFVFLFLFEDACYIFSNALSKRSVCISC